jgi:predicted nucleic acid-binding protein
VDTQDATVEVIADPADSPIQASLVVSDAEALVTGDSDLLALKENYPIVTPAQFASQFK